MKPNKRVKEEEEEEWRKRGKEARKEGREEGAWIETNESLVAVFALLFQEEVRQTTTRQGQRN